MKKQLMACSLSFALLLGMIPTADVSAAKKVSLSTKKLTITKGKSKTLKVKNTKKKVTWKVVSGKKYISVKKKGKTAVTIKGVKKGKAKVQAKAEKKTLTCTVTVKNAETKDSGSKTTEQTVVTPPSVTVTPPATTEQPSGTQTPPSVTPPPETTGQPTGTQTPTPTVEPTGESVPKNEQDVAALKVLIAEQRGRGATVSEDINDSKQYVWKNERLTEIHWGFEGVNSEYNSETNITGDISFSAFDALEFLGCGYNQLTSLDVSKNINLTELECGNNQLTSLDVSNNVNLTILYCFDNQLSSLDVGKNVNLTTLGCSGNQLSSLDVSNNVELTWLNCSGNQLGSLDVSNNVNLTVLNCSDNKLGSLNLTKNTKLTTLHCDDTVVVTGYNK